MLSRLTFLTLLVLLLAGCGYRPASHYTKNKLGDKIYAEVSIPIRSPEYAIAITDAVREAIVGRFKADIAEDKNSATSVLKITSATHSVSGLQTDGQGITVSYRATVTLKTTVYGTNLTARTFSVTGTYDFPAGTDTTLSEQRKLDAVKEAAGKALDGLLSKLAIRVI
ncbi:MAG: LPS assembly lipoprotein LptE [Campylobacterales bacterium]|nr:LPS assembly lipoprotein LptE [Campylobacterales bacterium]